MPVVLGAGLRLLENLDPERCRLEKLAVRDIGADQPRLPRRHRLTVRLGGTASARLESRHEANPGQAPAESYWRRLPGSDTLGRLGLGRRVQGCTARA